MQDPTEHHDLADSQPDIVAKLWATFNESNAEHHPRVVSPPIDAAGFCKSVLAHDGWIAPGWHPEAHVDNVTADDAQQNNEAAQLPSFLFILADDIGWADFGYHNGSTALTPHISRWVKQPGSILFHDFHSGGTHCTPTRASVLTGRTPFRDCVFGTKGADGDDMTEMIDNFTFAPKRTFTIADAVRAASPEYFSMHFG